MYYIIANETHIKGKSAQKLNTVRRVFSDAGIESEVLYTRREGDAKNCAEKITSEGKEHTIVAMGGDGTLHDILNGFKDFDKCSLGLIPSGTGNDFAAAAKIPLDVEKAAKIIVDNAPRPIDFIELSSGVRSINAVGMGIDVDVLKRAYSGKSHKKSKYLKALIVSLIKFRSCNFTVRYDGKEEKHFGLIAALGNGRQIGGGIRLFPEAEIADGYLDLFIVDYISRFRILGAFIKLMKGKVNSVKGATAIRTKAAEFICEDDNPVFQADGELYRNTPLNAHIVSGKLKFYLP